MARFGDEYSPNIIQGDNTMALGYVSKDGKLHDSTTITCSDYLPVKEGYLLRGYTHQMGVFGLKGFRFLCAYDETKTPISSAGSNVSVAEYTVPEGVSFVRVSFDQAGNGSNYMVSVNIIDVAYTEYTPPMQTITDNFLTIEADNFLNTIMTNGISTTDFGYSHGCAYPHSTPLVQTVGLPETWFYKNAVTPYSPYQYISAGIEYSKRYNDKITFGNNNAVNSSNGFIWWVGDIFMNRLDSEKGQYELGRPRRILTENLSDCSLLAIGDSTVDHDTMTATLLSHFNEQGHILTLLGTLGDTSAENRNEGRAGWKASDYFTDRQYQGVTNPFYNPGTQTFDFGYYMTNQGYSTLDFVLLQLGINDIYNNANEAGIIESTWNYISSMIQSILAYNSSIKVLLNLPTPPNSDQEQHSNILFVYWNTLIRYNEYDQAHALSEFGRNSVRATYCHLILDPDTEIRDNVHPTVEGYQKMALEVVNQINAWQNNI